MKKIKKLSKKIIAIIIAACIIAVLLITCLGLQIAFMQADKIQCWRPNYEKLSSEEIYAILDKEVLDYNDYAVLYMQTGLTKIGIDRALEYGSAGKSRILAIHDDFFAEHTVINDFFAPFVCQDTIDDKVNYIYLENGDILVSSSTHISGWRAGHAGLVTNANYSEVLQASAVGSSSKVGYMYDFATRVNFMILSPKVDTDIKEQVVSFALENLVKKPYDPTAGVFSNKKSIDRTQCSHLVWSAYEKFGIDLDSNGGLVVTPKDLANSPLVDVVQVFGLDPVKLWK